MCNNLKQHPSYMEMGPTLWSPPDVREMLHATVTQNNQFL